MTSPARKKIKWKYYVNYAVGGALTVLFGILSVAGGLDQGTQFLLEKIGISIILAV